MSSLVSLNLTALSPAIASTLPSLEHLQSCDYFQQMLLTDSALEALSISKSGLELKLRSRSVSGGRPSSAEVAVEYDVIMQSIADLEEVVKTFEDLQAEARHLFELRARSLRQREKSIMDLPTEVLLSIFKNFRPPIDFSTIPLEGRNDEPDVETIKSIRLTCFRFCQISSHLLIGRLSVSPDMASLDRLERVSSHPEISRGELILSLDLKCYSASTAGDIYAFTALCFKKLNANTKHLISTIKDELKSNIERRRDAESSERSDESLPQGRQQGGDDEGQERGSSLLVEGMSLQSARNAVQQLRRILSIWKPFKSGTGESIEGSAQLDAAVLALQRGHERYRELYQQQQRLIQDGSFVRAVAAAAAASKSKVWLCMSDENTVRFSADLKMLARSNFLSFKDPRCFDHALSYMVRPQSWSDLESDMARNRSSEDAEVNLQLELPQSLLCQVPVAMHVAGTKLARLDVSITYPPEKLDLSMSDEQLSSLTEATKGLETFKVVTDAFLTGYTQPNLKKSQDLYAYVRAAMGRQIVPNLSLDLDTREIDSEEDREALFSIEPLLRSSNWRGLKSAELGYFEVGLEGLRELVDMLEPGTRLELWQIHLTSGTWAAALDCIRSKASQDSWLREASGAECDLMPDEKYDEIFDCFAIEDFKGKGSKATQYIRSVEGVENPLLTWDDGAAESDLEP